MWWTDDQIERTVTRAFVCSHLLQEEIARLDRPLAFGDGLTDGTYWEWIDQKAKKLFLILVDLHMPDQIFGVIDDSWDDEDLPIAREHVERLALTPHKDDRLERKFYQRQFFYLLRPLARNDLAVVYDDTAVVPLDLVDLRRTVAVGAVVGHHHSSGSLGSGGGGGLGDEMGGGGGGAVGSTAAAGTGISSSASASASASSSSSSGTTTVTLPNYPGFVLLRRRVPLAPAVGGRRHGSGSGASPNGSAFPLAPAITAAAGGSSSNLLTLAEFQYEVSRIRGLQNDHMVSYFASYVHQGFGYVLFTPASDSSIKSLLATTPAPFKALTKRDRRRLIFNWIHCLVDTLCFVHHRGLSHGNIKPSTVLLRTADLHIFFSDCTPLFGSAASSSDLLSGASSSPADKASFDKESYDYAAPEQWYRPPGGGGVGIGIGGGGSSAGSIFSGIGGGGGGSSSRNGAVSDGGYFGSQRGGGGGSGGTGVASLEYASTSTSFSISRSSSGSMQGGGGDYGASSLVAAGLAAPIPQLNPQAADVFSLGCIVLELLSLMLKRQTRAFATHRAAKHKTPGRGGAVLDSSFHKNLGQIESWMSGLAKDAQASLSKHRGGGGGDGDEPDTTLAGVAPLLHVVERMLALHASERPSIFDVQTRMYQILRDQCGITEPHCVHQYGGGSTAAAAIGISAAAAAAADWSDYDYDYAYGSPSSSYGTSLHINTTANNYSYASGSSRAVSPTASTAAAAMAQQQQQQQQQQQMMIMQLGQSWGSSSTSSTAMAAGGAGPGANAASSSYYYAETAAAAGTNAYYTSAGVKGRSVSSTPHYRPTYHHPRPAQQQQQQQQHPQRQHQQIHASASSASLHTSSSSSHYGFQGGGRRRHARVPSNGGRSSGGGGGARDSAEDVANNNTSPPGTAGGGSSSNPASPGGGGFGGPGGEGVASPLSPSASSSSLLAFTKIKTNSSSGSTSTAGGGGGGGSGGGGIDLTNGLQAIRNLQIRDKVRAKKTAVGGSGGGTGALEVLEGVEEREEAEGEAADGDGKKEKKEKKEKKHKDWFVYGPIASAHPRRSVNA